MPCAPAQLRTPTAKPPGRDRGELLGTTRTAALTAIGNQPLTTTELARTLGIAISGASQHASVLRRAGLLQTSRDGGRVWHSLTGLGRHLLNQLPR